MSYLKNVFYLFLLMVINNYGQAYLSVNDPRGWGWGEGTIEEAVVSIQPKGLYFEYGLYLTISAKGMGFNHQDTLEAVLDFHLPENSIVTDSWLWVEEDIIRAKVLDKWTASQIYEDIVGRRKDPSILLKTWSNGYNLRIYPMAGDESRKVKLTIQVPALWNSKSVSTSLPLDILRASSFPLNSVAIISRNLTDWKNPKIIQLSERVFEQKNDPILGDFLRLDLTNQEIYNFSNLDFSVDAPFKNGVFLSKYEGIEENYYQLAYLPSMVISNEKRKKVAILVDYDASNSSLNDKSVITNIKTMLLNHFKSTDYFNLIFSNLQINRISENWLKADSNTVDSVFNALPEKVLSTYSNLPALLSNGISFVDTKGYDAELFLISNSDEVGDSEVANSLIHDLMILIKGDLPISVGNFQESNFYWYWIGGRNYKGNEYFNQNISRLTGGNSLQVSYNYGMNQMLSDLIQSIGSVFSTYDLYTTMENGFCYARYDLSSTKGNTFINTPILQIGKYTGDYPFKIQFNGVIDKVPVSKTHVKNLEEISEADSISESIWAGNYINRFEQDNYNLTNSEIGDIINFSIEKRVLSEYTAFICLEPGLGGEIYYDAVDESDAVIGVEDGAEIQADTLFQAYPNPFNNQTTIKIRLSKSVESSSTTFKIYNILGQVVKSFIPENNSTSNEFEFIWNGMNENNSIVSSGQYFFVMSYEGKVKTLKLMLVK